MKKVYIFAALIALLAASLACSAIPLGPSIEIPEDWDSYTNNAMGITIHHPDDWSYYEYDDYKFVLESDDGTYELEIYYVDEASAEDLDFDYDPGMSSETLMDNLLELLEEEAADFAIGNYVRLKTLAGTATTSNIRRDDEEVLVAILPQDDFALFMFAYLDRVEIFGESNQLYKDVIATTASAE